MSNNKDYVPHPDDLFNLWILKLIAYVTNITVVWNIPGSEIIALNVKIDKWTAEYSVGGLGQKGDRTAKQVNDKNEARADLEKAVRLFIKAWLAYNPAVTNADRIAMQIPVHDATPTPEPVPDKVPLVDIAPLQGAMILFNFSKGHKEAGVKHRGKPEHTHGLKIYYKLGDPAPTGIDDCNKTVTATKTPYKLKLTQADATKKIYCYCCWVNNREVEGPLTKMITEVVHE